jgi:hypothetical protein
MIENYPVTEKKNKHGFRRVFLSAGAFESLIGLQSRNDSHGLNIHFGLKDLATAFVQVGVETPGFRELVLSRALDNARQQLNQDLLLNDKELHP